MLSKELHQEKYEAISVSQDKLCSVKKTQRVKSQEGFRILRNELKFNLRCYSINTDIDCYDCRPTAVNLLLCGYKPHIQERPATLNYCVPPEIFDTEETPSYSTHEPDATRGERRPSSVIPETLARVEREREMV
ncbi:hypothetical protein TNCV_2479121 [Trichonephila clavipes]|nr:hypothetical protein TNCV_2479121 [Trichonephila clavipes]